MFCRRHFADDILPTTFSRRIFPVEFSGSFPRWYFAAAFQGRISTAAFSRHVFPTDMLLAVFSSHVSPVVFSGGISCGIFRWLSPVAFPGGISGAFSSSFLRWLFPAVSSSGISEVFFLRHCRRIFIILIFRFGFRRGEMDGYALPRLHRPACWWWRRVVRRIVS